MADAFEKFDVPSGGWVALRDPKLITQAQRRPVAIARIRAGGSRVWAKVAAGESMTDVTDDEIAASWKFLDTLAVALVSEWSFDAPITSESLVGLVEDDYEEVIAAALKHLPTLMPEFGVDPDRDSPTDASDGSATDSEAPQSPTLTPPNPGSSAVSLTSGVPTNS